MPNPQSAIRNPQSEGPGAMELHVSREHRTRANALLASLGVGVSAELIGINPGATMAVKRWPVERFAAIGHELAVRRSAQILVLGGPGDEERAEAITQAVPGAVCVAGRTRLGETAAMLRRCRLLISGDTGPLHMAVALGVPTVGLFGPTNPGKYGPWRGHDRASRPDDRPALAAVLRHPEPCGECDRPCVHTISVAECLAAAERCLGVIEGRSLPEVAPSAVWVAGPVRLRRQRKGWRRG
jgi:ADP-heptose:LPS heptosyltransferase